MIVIIGGGITGLLLAHQLASRGVDYLVLESKGEPGGVMRSRSIEDRALDLGPQRTRLTPSMTRLVDELGLRKRLLLSPELPLYVFRAGKLRRVPFSLGEAMRTNLFSPAEKLRILLEPLSGAARPRETVAGFLSRKFGRAAYLHMLGPLYGGLYASDPADMVMEHSLGRALDFFGLEGRSLLLGLVRLSRNGRSAPPACSFVDGMQELPRALAARYGERVRLQSPVTALQQLPAGGHYDVHVGDEVVAATTVILTVPAAQAAALLRDVAPAAATRLALLNYNRLAVVHLIADCPLVGFGYQVSLAERLVTRGVTFNASMFGRPGVFTAYLGGATHPEVVDWTDDRIGQIAADEFRVATGCEARAVLVTRVEMPAWDRSWDSLAGLELPRGIVLAANYESRAGIEGRLARAREVAESLLP